MPVLMLMVLMVSLAVGGVGILGVDFAANASSKAIKEDISLSAAPDDASATYTTSINASNQYVYTFNYNGTYPLNKVNISGPRVGYYTYDNTLGMDGSAQSIKLPAGKYKLEVWGAQGGEGYYGNTYGGRGGYSYGTITLTSETTLYVAVGGKGSDTYRNEKTNGPASGGGWNGGGHLVSTGGATGGGATHIATALRGDGQLKNYASYKTEVLLVGGGGGGGAHDVEAYLGGGGGGKNGGQSGSRGGYVGSSYSHRCHGLGATTSTGGGHINNSSAHSDTTSWNTPCSNGSFGMGGNGTG
ncbi:MAG: hypothetical protein K2M95_08120, partial [Clostridiales bacterium]|nr:hypothetical protein [Clostridiales bacterium]